MTPHTLEIPPLELGRSVEGRPLLAYGLVGPDRVIDTPACMPTACDTLFLGAFHGDEGPSADLLDDWRDWLASGDAPREALTARGLSYGSMVLVPVVNPDGLAAGCRVNARGVDLNRNYPTRTWAPSGDGTPYYTGPSPASEPETRVLLALIARLRPRKIITIHTPYRVVNYDGPGEALAQAMAAANGYPVVADIGYPTPGSFGTYWGIERQVPVITLELPENLPENLPEDSPEKLSRKALWQANRPALLAAALFEAPPSGLPERPVA